MPAPPLHGALSRFSRCWKWFIRGRKSPLGAGASRPPAPSAPLRGGTGTPPPSGETERCSNRPLGTEDGPRPGEGSRPRLRPPRHLRSRTGDRKSGLRHRVPPAPCPPAATPFQARGRPRREGSAHAREGNGRRWRSSACAGARWDMRREARGRPAAGQYGRPRLP